MLIVINARYLFIQLFHSYLPKFRHHSTLFEPQVLSVESKALPLRRSAPRDVSSYLEIYLLAKFPMEKYRNVSTLHLVLDVVINSKDNLWTS